MTEAHISHYIPRDNIQSTARPLGELLVQDEVTVNENGGLSIGDQEVMAPGQFRVRVDDEGVKILLRNKEVKE